MKAQRHTLPHNLATTSFHRHWQTGASKFLHLYNSLLPSKCLHLSTLRCEWTVVSSNKILSSNYVVNTISKPAASQVLSGARGDSHVSCSKHLTADDIVSGAVDVVGWTVKFEVMGGSMGKVSEVIQVPGPRTVLDHGSRSLTWLKVVESPAICRDTVVEPLETHSLEGTVPSGTHGVILKQHKRSSSESIPLATEILVPVVDKIVKTVDKENMTLIIFPPKGLLELARRPEAIRRLRPAIQEFCKQHPPQNVRKRLTHTRIKNLGLMPTQKQLQQAGVQWLMKEINAAGGLLYVAQALNLGAGRRPAGFWEDLTQLDIEIERFIWERWTKKLDKSTETHYYWNPVTNEVSKKKPPFPNMSNFAKTKGAVMPRRITVIEAKRWDLNHAIFFHGGYKAVGHALKRWTVFVYGRKTSRHLPPKQKLKNESSSVYHSQYGYSVDVKGIVSKTLPVDRPDLMTLSQVKLGINRFMEARGLSDFPAYKDLQEHDQNLFVSVKKLGGRRMVAKAMHIKLRRSKHGRWSSISTAAAALRSYICRKFAAKMNVESGYDEEYLWTMAVSDGSLKLPTHAEVLNDGRPDLHYVLQRFGRHQLAEHLMIPQRVMLEIDDKMLQIDDHDS